MITFSYFNNFLLIICHILFKLEIFLKKKSKSKLTERMTTYKFKYYCTEKLMIMNRRLIFMYYMEIRTSDEFPIAFL